MKPSQGRVLVYEHTSPWSSVLPFIRWTVTFLLLLATLIAASSLIDISRVDARLVWNGVGGADETTTGSSGSDDEANSGSAAVDEGPLNDGPTPTATSASQLDDYLADGVLDDDELALLTHQSPTPSAAASVAATPSPSAEPSPSPTPSPSPVVEDTDTRLALALVATAGADQLVQSGDLVVLDATASNDPVGGGLTYSWRQLEGPPVVLSASDTATPSFTVADEDASYIFAVTIQDHDGRVAADVVTVAAQSVDIADTRRVADEAEGDGEATEQLRAQLPVVRDLLHPFDVVILLVALLATFISLYDTVFAGLVRRIVGLFRRRHLGQPGLNVHTGRVVDYKTGKPIWGAKVAALTGKDTIYAHDTTNQDGQFSLALPIGTYRLDVNAPGFDFSQLVNTYPIKEDDVLYTGGSLHIDDQGKNLSLVIPMKPTGKKVSHMRYRLLRLWQLLQRRGYVWSWTIFIVGSLLNTVLLFLTTNYFYLILEVIYIGLIISKVTLEAKKRPSYGMVRDAVTHVPLDLAVVRLYEQNSNRLVMTRATDGQGRFFALPPTGLYRLVVSKTGYATFIQDNMEITNKHDTSIQIKAELMQVLPSATMGPSLAPL